MIGDTLSHYRILDKLGEGGMGVVYRAVDVRLDRTVALKVLAARATGDPERRRRFIQEAKAASALNHPNIITIYEIDQAATAAGPVDFIAMEYVDGETLERRIGRKGLALGEALDYAVQIADALARAHAAGIVHRDIKPANLMVNREGRMKVLDFGLAKLTERAEGGEFAATMDAAPRTEEGTIAGTISYMSPEQAEGKPIDARSDIFSFGSVLYEMVSGRRAFHAETKVSTLSAVLREEPPAFAELGLEAPREVERLIRHCLRKDLRRRFQHMEDVKTLLEELKEESDSGTLVAAAPGAGARPARRGRVWLVAVAAALALAVAAGVGWRLRKPPAAARSLVLTQLTRDAGLTTEPALSPDGKLVAYASDRAGEGNLDIWVQQLAGGAPIRLTQDPVDDHSPSFSPDGARIVFVSERQGGGIWVVSTFGGDERLVAPRGIRPRFSPDGNWIAYYSAGALHPARIYVVAAAGGPPREFQADVPWAMGPVWSPDGKFLLFVGSTGAAGTSVESTDWRVAPVEGGKSVATGAAPVLRAAGLGAGLGVSVPRPADWVGNHVIFSAQLGDSTNVWRVTLAPGTWQVKEAAQRLTGGAGREQDPSAAPNGSLAFASVAIASDLWALPIDANRGKALGAPQRLTQDAAGYGRPSLSGDGRKMVFGSLRSGRVEVWIRDLESGKDTMLSAASGGAMHPGISPDGSRVFYVEGGMAKPVIHLVSSGGGVAERLCEDCGLPTDWSADGRYILYYRDQPARYLALAVASRQKAEVLRHPRYNIHRATLSPDGRWVAFHVPLEGVRSRVYVTAFHPGAPPPESEWIPVTGEAGSDAHPWWSPDGNLLYFVSPRDGFPCIWTQRLDLVTRRPAGAPAEFHHFHGARQILNRAIMGPGISRDKLVFTLLELTGNVWLAR